MKVTLGRGRRAGKIRASFEPARSDLRWLLRKRWRGRSRGGVGVGAEQRSLVRSLTSA